MNYLWYDTETGGINPDVHSLLTAFFAVCDKQHNIIDELYLQLKPSDLSKLNVEPQALKVNNINLDDHLNDPQTLTYEEGQKVLVEFYEKHKIKGKRRSLQPCGHNILVFDNPMIWNNLMPREVWDKYVHYRTIDTVVGCNILKDWGLLPQDVGNLESLVEHFNIPKKETHHAKGDVLMNIEVYKAMGELGRSIKKQATNTSSSNSLLDIVEV